MEIMFSSLNDSKNCNVLSMLLNITIETLLTITEELYTKMFHDQKFRVSSCV